MTVPSSEFTPASAIKFEFAGRTMELLPIVLLNALLNILTLTVYRFWGKSRVRRYLWGSVKLLDDRFEYTGTGGELFKGFLFVVIAVLLPIGVLNSVIEINFSPEETISIVYNALIFLVVWFLIGVALYRARRYRLSRTLWRGVRAGQSGSSFAYGAKYLGFILLNILTLGWVYPLMRIRLMHQMMNNTWFGDGRFSFAGSARHLYGRFAICWFLLVSLIALFGGLSGAFSVIESGSGVDALAAILPFIIAATVVGIIVLIPLVFCWYFAVEISYFAKSTQFEGLQFELQATLGGLFWLIFGNLLISILTLGFGIPFTQMRTFKYVCQRLEASGHIDFEAIIQNADQGPGAGEGLADAFDVGAV